MTRSEKTRKPSLGRWTLSAFVLLTCLRVWIGPTPVVQSAYAQIPDSGLQRKQTIEEIKRTNALLSEIRNLLKDGTLNVRVAGADKKAGASAPPRVPRRAKP